MNTSSKMLRAMVVPKAMPRHTLMLRFTRAYCWAPKFCPTKVVMAMPKALITIQMKPSILPMAAQEAMASVPKELMLACTTRRGGLTPEEMSSIDDRDMSDGKLARAMAAAEPRLSPGQILALMYALDEETLSRAVTESREPFTPEQIIELVDNVDEDALSKAVRSAKEPFTPEQVTELIDYVDDGALSKAVKNTKGKFTKEQREELEDSGFCFSNGIFEDTDGGKESGETVHEFGGGCLLGLLGIFLGSSKKEDGSSCHDSAPHYGYRYGRWYYGNDHSYGCENEKKKK